MAERNEQRNLGRAGYYETRESMRALGMLQLLHAVLDPTGGAQRARYEAPRVLDLPRRDAAPARVPVGRVSVR